MSRKIDAFRLAVPQPLTKKDITMLCPQLAEGALLAQSMSFPSENMGEATYYYKGRPLYTPTRTNVPGDWTVDIADNVLTLVRYHMQSFMYAKKKFNVTLVPGDLTDILSGAVSLDILGLLRSATTSAIAALFSGITLCDAWIKTMAPVDFSASGATEVVTWRVTIRYNYIKPFIRLL